MKISAVFGQSLRSIWSNKVRSSLTILGIVIGIAAVIALVGLGKGLQASVEGQLGDLNATAITVQSEDPSRPEAEREHGRVFNFGASSQENLTLDDYATIRQTDGITAASPETQSQTATALTADAETATAYQLYGIDTQYTDIKEIDLVEGNNLTQQQIDNTESVLLIGKDAAGELFPNDTAYVGKTVYLKDEAFTIVGVVDQDESKSSSGLMGGGSKVTSSMYTGYKRWLTLNSKEKLSTVTATAKDEDSVQEVADDVTTALLSAHGITDTTQADFAVNTSEQLLSTIEGVTSGFSTTLTGIAAISLIVGGIGIMNIMLVTVTERTREIGLRRAVGAKNRHILIQFLTESVLLTLIGGGIGLLLGVGFSSKAGQILTVGPGQQLTGSGQTAIVDAQTILLAVGISALIGIVFGLFPAIKAAKLDPVEALRYE